MHSLHQETRHQRDKFVKLNDGVRICITHRHHFCNHSVAELKAGCAEQTLHLLSIQNTISVGVAQSEETLQVPAWGKSVVTEIKRCTKKLTFSWSD